MSVTSELSGANACSPALKWMAQYDSYEDIWNNCHRGDWLLWFVYILDVDPQLVVRTAIECARFVADNSSSRFCRNLPDAIARAEDWNPAEINSARVKQARDMIELASHCDFFSGPNMDALQSMVEIVRQRIPWSIVEAQIEVVDGKLARKV